MLFNYLRPMVETSLFFLHLAKIHLMTTQKLPKNENPSVWSNTLTLGLSSIVLLMETINYFVKDYCILLILVNNWNLIYMFDYLMFNQKMNNFHE